MIGEQETWLCPKTAEAYRSSFRASDLIVSSPAP